MMTHHLTDPQTPIGDILPSVGSEGVLLEDQHHARSALMPLDDDVLDFLIERSPRFREECSRIRDAMREGKSIPHAEARRLLEGGNG